MDVYRLILETSPGRVDTGATYQGCTRANPDACQPVQFSSVQDAINFAHQRGEVPVKVPNEIVAWDIVDGRHAITDDMIITSPTDGIFSSLTANPMLLAGVAVAAIFILPKLLGGRKRDIA